MKIILGLVAAFYAILFLSLGVAAYYGLKEKGLEPLETVNKYLIFWWLGDLVMRYFLKKNPILKVRPLLSLPISKDKITHYLLGKSAASFFNFYPAFFLLPFTVTLLLNGYNPIGIIGWHLALFCLTYINNYFALTISHKKYLFFGVAAVLIILGFLVYQGVFDITLYTAPLFMALYNWPFLALLLMGVLYLLYRYNFTFFRKSLYLDDGVKEKEEVAETRNYEWINRFGLMGTFLKNDLRLILRNKRSKTAVLTAGLLLFYGLILFTSPTYSNSGTFKIIAGLMISGGFLFSFGGFVPSWDSAYYPLMMSQNIQYREYLSSKWWLIVVATIASMILSSFYLFISKEIYLVILATGVYNIGINAYLTLIGGAYTKTPIDLSTGKKPFGDKKAFNLKTLLLLVPELLLPIAIYLFFSFFFDKTIALITIAAVGLIGLLFRNLAFRLIEKAYKEEKYDTLAAFKKS